MFKTKTNDILKLIAIITMIIDHVGFVFFPQLEILRIIGRISIPIFSYQLTQGYKHTSNLKRYIFRLFFFGMISQIPFFIIIDPKKLNIIITLFFSAIFLRFFEKKKYIIALLILAMPFVFSMDGDYLFFVMTFIFYKFPKQKLSILLLQSINILVYYFVIDCYINLFYILGVLLVLYFPRDKFKVSIGKWFFYWFYPIHLIWLILIRLFI